MTVTSVKDLTSFKWATVTGNNPLAIKLDGDTAPLALIPDSLVDPVSLTVGDRVRVELSLRKVVIHGVASGGALAGEVRMTAVSAAPTGWLLCQGQSLLRSSYARLFSAIGTTYGTADSTHFNVPDLRGRVAVGRDSAQTEFNVLGETGGAKTHVLTTAEMPSHSHGLNMRLAGSATYSFAGAGDAGANNNNNPGVVQSTGGGGAHNNIQPYIALNYIIKV